MYACISLASVCISMIEDFRIRKVFYATSDPGPLNGGRTNTAMLSLPTFTDIGNNLAAVIHRYRDKAVGRTQDNVVVAESETREHSKRYSGR